jgi:hypothetical protein
METISAQVKRIADKHKKNFAKASIKAINNCALYLQGAARKASPSGSETKRNGKYVWQAIKVDTAKTIPIATVYLDYQTNPLAVWLHERDKQITITPKESKYLYIPLTAEGRQHELHARDSVTKGLKGFLSSADSGQHSAFLGNTTKEGKLDFVLKKSVTLPPSKYAGFLTSTAKQMHSRLLQIFNTIIKANL